MFLSSKYYINDLCHRFQPDSALLLNQLSKSEHISDIYMVVYTYTQYILENHHVRTFTRTTSKIMEFYYLRAAYPIFIFLPSNHIQH